MNCEFSFNHYEEILKLAKKEYKFSDFLTLPDLKTKRIYLRHDVDISLDRALILAKIENKNNVVSTFLIQISTPFYNPFDEKNVKIIKEIKKLGHYVGLHYNGPVDLSDFKLEKNIELQLDMLSSFFQIDKVVSFHQPSKKLFNKKFKNFISTYEPNFYKNKNIKYISDSKGGWREGCACKFIAENSDKYYNLQILTHPIWWDKENYSVRQHLDNKYLKETIAYFKKEFCENISSYCKKKYEKH